MPDRRWPDRRRGARPGAGMRLLPMLLLVAVTALLAGWTAPAMAMASPATAASLHRMSVPMAMSMPMAMGMAMSSSSQPASGSATISMLNGTTHTARSGGCCTDHATCCRSGRNRCTCPPRNGCCASPDRCKDCCKDCCRTDCCGKDNGCCRSGADCCRTVTAVAARMRALRSLATQTITRCAGCGPPGRQQRQPMLR